MYLGSKKNPFGNLYCKEPDLQIKCKDSSFCKCSSGRKKKKHFFKIKGRKLKGKSKHWKFYRKRNFWERKAQTNAISVERQDTLQRIVQQKQGR